MSNAIYKNLSLKDLDGEVWADIQGYENIYQISNLGRVKSLCRNRKKWKTKHGISNVNQIIEERILKQNLNKYLYVRLFNNSEYIGHAVHRLVGAVFVPNPNNLPEINHKKGIKTDNRATEIEWSTHPDNMKHAVLTGLHRTNPNWGAKNPCSKPVEKRDIEGNLLKTFVSATYAAQSVGVCCSSIANCCLGKYKLIKGFKWNYKY